MTDELVTRLRGDWFGYEVSLKAIDAMNEAADRIEALTTHIDSYRVANMQLLVEITQAFERIEALTAERDRLKKALPNAREAWDNHMGYGEPMSDLIRRDDAENILEYLGEAFEAGGSPTAKKLFLMTIQYIRALPAVSDDALTASLSPR